MTPTLHVGDRVLFDTMKFAFTVRACNDRFAICTRPFAPRKTVLYCVIDKERKVRGPEDLVFGVGAKTDQQCQEMLFGVGAKTDQQCQEMLERVTSGQSRVSRRRELPLTIQKVTSPK